MTRSQPSLWTTQNRTRGKNQLLYQRTATHARCHASDDLVHMLALLLHQLYVATLTRIYRPEPLSAQPRAQSYIGATIRIIRITSHGLL